MFRGREMTHTELGKRLLDRLADDMEELAAVEAYPKVDGRNMVMVLAPTKKKERPEEADDEATDPVDDATGADAEAAEA